MPSSLYLFLTAYRSLNNLSASLLPQPLPPIVRPRVHSVLARCASSCAPAPSRNVISRTESTENGSFLSSICRTLAAPTTPFRATASGSFQLPEAQRVRPQRNHLRMALHTHLFLHLSYIIFSISSTLLPSSFPSSFDLLLESVCLLFGFPFISCMRFCVAIFTFVLFFTSRVLTFLTFSDHVSRTVYS